MSEWTTIGTRPDPPAWPLAGPLQISDRPAGVPTQESPDPGRASLSAPQDRSARPPLRPVLAAMGPPPMDSSTRPDGASAVLLAALAASLVFGEFAAEDARPELLVSARSDPIRSVVPSGDCPAILRDLLGIRGCTPSPSSSSCHACCPLRNPPERSNQPYTIVVDGVRRVQGARLAAPTARPGPVRPSVVISTALRPDRLTRLLRPPAGHFPRRL
jgi:hypothetical protein